MEFLLESGFHRFSLYQLQLDKEEVTIKIREMDDKVIFIVGFVIFCLYLIGFLSVIHKQNSIQDEELKNDPEIKND